MSTLVVDRRNRLERARRLTGWSEEELRRFAVEAAANRDPDALWELLEAHRTLYSPAGAGLSPHTLRSYRRGLQQLLAAWEGENLLRPGRDAGTMFVRSLEERSAPATVRSRVAAAKALYAALRWAGATIAAPFSDVRIARDPTPAWSKVAHYSEQEIAALVVAGGPRDQVLVLLGAHAGLRVSEIVALTWKHIDLGSGWLVVEKGKGGKKRRARMSPALTEALERLAEAPESVEGRVLGYSSTGGAYKRLQRLSGRAGVKFKGVHALRHSAGTRLARDEGLQVAADHLGHASLDTTRVYAKLDQSALDRSVGSWRVALTGKQSGSSP